LDRPPRHQDPATDKHPAWSPDGRELAFRRTTEAGAGVYLISALGGPERKVADLGRTVAWPPSLAWTPDGKGLIAIDNDPREGEGIFLIPLGSGERRRLTPKPKYADTSLSLSPDGRRLAYAACATPAPARADLAGRLGRAHAPRARRLGTVLGPRRSCAETLREPTCSSHGARTDRPFRS